MDSLDETTQHPAPPPPPRERAIELLQLLSLLAFGVAAVLYWPGGSNVPIYALLALGAALFAIPLLLPRLPKRRRRGLQENGQGFKITRDRRETLAELVPEDILRAIDDSMLDVHFTTDVEMREVLHRVVGPDRVEPWADVILLHAGTQEEARPIRGI
ncbi:MAG TPA: hypothetical protein VOA80_09155 [Thermoanaerobaculia bacterium]|nr:hypothetical protein [Thermoanaerobaculia bacterium]